MQRERSKAKKKKKRPRLKSEMHRRTKDTIAAVTTPLGEGGIGVVQVSGPEALETVSRVFRWKGGGKICSALSGQLLYGTLVDDVTSTLIDEAIVCVWRSEESFTGDDLVEINCHGGPRAVRNTLHAVIGAGAREVEWAEFLGRGLESNRMDFIQIEAQEALVRAKTRLSVKTFLAQHQGLLSRRISSLETYIDAIADLATNDPHHKLPQEDVSNKLTLLLNGFDELLSSSAFGLALSSPQRVSIAGPPNVGKSTLFNALLAEERAIVHHIPGTTRDYISEYFAVHGIPFELVDSAGLRKTDDHVERMGVERAHDLHKRVDKIILMLDGSKEMSKEEWSLVQELGLDLGGGKFIPVVNKIDLGVTLDTDRLKTMFDQPICLVSALKGTGRESLERALVRKFLPYIDCYETSRRPMPVVFTKRQQSVLSHAREVVNGIIEVIVKTEKLDHKALGVVRNKLKEFRCGDRHKVSQETLQEAACIPGMKG